MLVSKEILESSSKQAPGSYRLKIPSTTTLIIWSASFILNKLDKNPSIISHSNPSTTRKLNITIQSQPNTEIII